MAQLKPGDMAPHFELVDQNGRKVKLSDFKGQKLLQAWYKVSPKDTVPKARQAI